MAAVLLPNGNTSATRLSAAALKIGCSSGSSSVTKNLSKSLVSRLGKNGVRKGSEKLTMSTLRRAASSTMATAPGTFTRQSSPGTGPVCAAPRVIMRAMRTSFAAGLAGQFYD